MIYTLEVARQSAWLAQNNSRQKVYSNSSTTLCPWISRTGVLTSGIPEDIRHRLEKELGYPQGHLDPVAINDAEKSFLSTFAVKLIGGKLTIDTSTPKGELIYQFCSHHYLVAKDVQSLEPKHEYVLRNEDAEAVKTNLKNQRRIDALVELTKMTIAQKRKCLRIMGTNSQSMSDELVTSRLVLSVELDPEMFYTKWINNTDKETEFLLESLVSMGVINKNRTSYRYGTDLIGSSKGELIDYLNKKENSDLYQAIQAEINAKLELKN